MQPARTALRRDHKGRLHLVMVAARAYQLDVPGIQCNTRPLLMARMEMTTASEKIQFPAATAGWEDVGAL